ncbi:uncharacterized protein LOC119412834 [Nematolebias whitei]|uniref:uncharacterized protein LOC119412834 n=1 Tax=Nematolebias whitei TaxID=451745 RepID=UPI00189A9C2F|nr:uncharacterized protein LOC119412834 [Nematolebias whitei]
MWKQQIKQRLDASVEEILGIFEQTVAEYKQELSRLKADVQQMMLENEEAHEEWRTGQQDPKRLNVKKKAEELWTSLEGEQLSRKEETDAAMFPVTAVVSKREDDKGELKFSQVRQDQVEYRDLPTSSSDDQMTVGTGGEGCGGAETTRNPDLNTHDDDFSSSETEVSDDYQDDKDGDNSDSELQHFSDSGPKTENKDEESGAPESGVNIVSTSFSCSECVSPWPRFTLLRPVPCSFPQGLLRGTGLFFQYLLLCGSIEAKQDPKT